MKKTIGLIITAGLISTASWAAPNDPYLASKGSWQQEFADQWAVLQQRLYADMAPQRPGEPVVVAVIDTGLDYTHADFADEKLWHNPREQKNGRDDDDNGFADDLVGWNFVDHNNNPWDSSGHGTHIAGIIAACTDNGLGIAAINPTAKIMPLKVANFIGQAQSAAVSAAIHYAVDNGARIINLSLGGELVSQLETNAARYAAERDVLIVVSAGNRGQPANRQGYPTLPGVLVVGASGLDGKRAGFSNFGSPLAVLAPGVDILSLRAQDTDFITLSDPLDYPQGAAFVGQDSNYYRASGTSFATAIVTGIASRLLSLRPQLNREQLARLITQTASDIEAPGVDQLSGYGLVNYAAALQADEDDFTNAELVRADLELQDAALFVNILGTADANRFASAELLIRAAADSIPPSAVTEEEKKPKRKRRSRDEQPPPPSPYEWRQLTPLAKPVRGDVLARFDIEEMTRTMQGSVSWELKLTVGAANGSSREAFMALELPRPPEQEVASE